LWRSDFAIQGLESVQLLDDLANVFMYEEINLFFFSATLSICQLICIDASGNGVIGHSNLGRRRDCSFVASRTVATPSGISLNGEDRHVETSPNIPRKRSMPLGVLQPRGRAGPQISRLSPFAAACRSFSRNASTRASSRLCLSRKSTEPLKRATVIHSPKIQMERCCSMPPLEVRLRSPAAPARKLQKEQTAG